jgi:hypothetical protein
MSGRPGFLGGIRQSDAFERDDSGFGPGTLVGDSPLRFGDPNGGRSEGGPGTPPGFDPIWGTLGAPNPHGSDGWLARSEADEEGLAVDVELFGDDFQISGQIRTGQFNRLSDWINMQTGFIQVRHAWHVHLGQTATSDRDQRRGTLWVRLSQVVLVAERSPMQASRPGAVVVQKQKRKVSIVTPGYNLLGSIHVHAYGSMNQYLETPDPHFLPMTDLTVRWLNDAAMVARFPFAMINREQLVTVLDQSESPAGDSAQGPTDSGADDDEMPFHRRFGAA